VKCVKIPKDIIHQNFTILDLYSDKYDQKCWVTRFEYENDSLPKIESPHGKKKILTIIKRLLPSSQSF